MAETNDKYRIEVIEKAVAVIEVLTERFETLSLTEIHHRRDLLSKPQIFRILKTLEGCGWVDRDGKKWRAGRGMVMMQLRFRGTSSKEMIR